MSSAYPAVQCISIHALLAESDGNIGSAGTVPPTISIHALLAESDAKADRIRALFGYFYPRSPCGERPPFLRSDPMMRPYFYPRSPCGERHPAAVPRRPDADISIHALLAESDPTMQRALGVFSISIHALLAESDTIFAVRPYDAPIFLSTLSLRRATPRGCPASSRRRYFYPRSPCGERQGNVHYMGVYEQISIHALLAESDHPDAGSI